MAGSNARHRSSRPSAACRIWRRCARFAPIAARLPVGSTSAAPAIPTKSNRKVQHSVASASTGCVHASSASLVISRNSGVLPPGMTRPQPASSAVLLGCIRLWIRFVHRASLTMHTALLPQHNAATLHERTQPTDTYPRRHIRIMAKDLQTASLTKHKGRRDQRNQANNA
jgi:hypothetical protein